MVAVPTPSQAAALRRLGLLRTDELAMIAAHWLIDLDTLPCDELQDSTHPTPG